MLDDTDKLLKALAYCDHIRELCKRKDIREEEIANLRSGLGMASSAILGNRVTTTPKTDSVPNAIARLEEMVDEFVSELTEYTVEIMGFTRAVEQLDESQASVLSMRFVRRMAYREIADRIHCDERTVYRYRESGLVALYDVMPSRWKSVSDMSVDSMQ